MCIIQMGFVVMQPCRAASPPYRDEDGSDDHMRALGFARAEPRLVRARGQTGLGLWSLSHEPMRALQRPSEGLLLGIFQCHQKQLELGIAYYATIIT